MFNIFDTREPEGDGLPIKGPRGKVLEFETEAAAYNHCMLAGINPRRVIIAPPDENDDETGVKCPGSCGAPAGTYCEEGCTSYDVKI